VDWLLDARRDASAQAAVQAVEDYLVRHTSDESRVPAALDSVATFLEEAGATHDGPLLLHLDWSRIHPRLSAHPAPGKEVPDPLVTVDVEDRYRLTSGVPGPSTVLGVPREVPGDFDPDTVPLAELDPFGEGPAATAVALAAASEAHPVASPDQVAAAAGALLADAAVGDGVVISARDAADLFLRLHGALGGDARTIHLADDCFELAEDVSPFGRAVCRIPSLTRMTEAIAGRLAARVTGRATVAHDESIALGDPVGRLCVFLGETDEEIAGSTYCWPPTGTHEQLDASPRMEMTVSLPRQSHSVPVIRGLAAQILRAFGAAAESIHDVELAISEACANVIQHAVDSEGYEVSIELASDRCGITVLDRGDGFDVTDVDQAEDFDAESGRGLSLMDALVGNLNFVSEPKVGAVVHMVKHLEYDNSHPFRRTAS
jgi:serine/threonine-protein kinase RsbW